MTTVPLLAALSFAAATIAFGMAYDGPADRYFDAGWVIAR